MKQRKKKRDRSTGELESSIQPTSQGPQGDEQDPTMDDSGLEGPDASDPVGDQSKDHGFTGRTTETYQDPR